MIKAHVHLITGGQRSGKSEYAEKQALARSKCPIYLATSKKWDDEQAQRIEVHQGRRSSVWQTIEEEISLGKNDLSGRLVLLDCITLWLTNIFTVQQFDLGKSWVQACKEWDELIGQQTHLIVVTNEIGMGTIPMERGARMFVDLHGQMNQMIATQASEVTFMISGIPWQVK